MRYTKKRKGGLAVGIMILLLGASIIPATTMAIEQIQQRNDQLREPNWNIEYLGESPTQYCNPYAVENQGSYTYVGSRSDWNHGMCPDYFGALDIYQTTDTQPIRIGGGTFDITEAFDLTVEGDYAYIAEINTCGWGGVTPGSYINEIDISNPSNANIQNKLMVEMYGMQKFKIFANGDFLYVLYPGYLYVYEIPIPAYGDWYVGRLQIPFSYVDDLVIKGNYAYLLGKVYERDGDSEPHWVPTLDIVDISNSYEPTLLKEIPCQDAQSISVTEAKAADVYHQGNVIYLATTAGLQIIEYSDLFHETLYYNYSMSNPSIALYASGNDLFVSSGIYGVTMLDISLPQYPIPEGYYTTNLNATALDISGNKIYATDDISGLLALRHIPEMIFSNRKPQGPTQGEIGVDYRFTINIMCVNQRKNNLYVNWSWGDYQFSGWQGPYHNGESASATHAWSQQGKYPVRFKVRDSFGFESRWSSPLFISIR